MFIHWRCAVVYYYIEEEAYSCISGTLETPTTVFLPDTLYTQLTPIVIVRNIKFFFLQSQHTHETHPSLISLLFFSLSPVKPNPPERLTVTVMEDKSWPFLRVSWEPPQKADTRSGWITLIYEIRVKLEEENDWEVRNVCEGMAWWFLSCMSLNLV